MATTAARKKHRDALDRDGHSGRHANTESWRGRRESLRDTVSDEQLERMICLMEGLAGQVSELDNKLRRMETMTTYQGVGHDKDDVRRRQQKKEPSPLKNNGLWATATKAELDEASNISMASTAPRLSFIIDKHVQPDPADANSSNSKPLSTVASEQFPVQERKGLCSEDIDWIWTENDTRMCFGFVPILPERHRFRLIFEMTTYVLVIYSIALIIGKSYSEDDADSEFMMISQATLTAWFTAEYGIRWSAVRPHKSIPRPYSFREFWEAKFTYMFSFMPMIDLLSFLPFYVELILDTQGQGDAMPSSALGVLRVVRVLRIFKLTRNNQTISDFFTSLHRIRKDLAVFLCVLLAMVIVFASAIFYAERNGPFGDQFNSIPICMWWTVITFTSVGYGDMFPATDAGYVIGAFAAIVGVLLMNVPMAFILISFDEVYSGRKEREKSMIGVVDRIFAWMDRNKRDDQVAEFALRRQIIQTLESSKRRGKGMTVKKMMVQVRQKRKRELWKQRKIRQRQKADLLEALMNPYRRSELLNSSDAAATRYKEDKDTQLVKRFAEHWMQRALKKDVNTPKRKGSPSKVYPAQTVHVHATPLASHGVQQSQV